VTNSGETAISIARTQAADGTTFGRGLCLQRVRLCYGVPALYPDAATAWRNAQYRHPQVDPSVIPRGVPVFWTGGSARHGHIAIATGDGECWSTDILRGGHWDKVPIGLIHQRWGLTLVGWTEDLNGARVYDPTTQEDDMPLTDDDVQKVAKAVIAQMIDVIQPDGSRVPWHMGALLRSIKAGQDATLVEVAKAQGLTPDQLAAIQKAIADAAVDVDVTVHNQTGA
jgi:hypothetical protein